MFTKEFKLMSCGLCTLQLVTIFGFVFHDSIVSTICEHGLLFTLTPHSHLAVNTMLQLLKLALKSSSLYPF
jgi:hypothetical protein